MLDNSPRNLAFTKKHDSQDKISSLRRISTSLHLHAKHADLDDYINTLTVEDFPQVHSQYDEEFLKGDNLLRVFEATSDCNHRLTVNPKIKDFYADVLQCARLREKYQVLSRQADDQNPANWGSWTSYPRPVKEYLSLHRLVCSDCDALIDSDSENEVAGDVTAKSTLQDTGSHYSGFNFSIKGFCEAFGIDFTTCSSLSFRNLDKGSSYPGLNGDIAFPCFEEYIDDLNLVIDTNNNSIGHNLTSTRLNYLLSKHEYYTLENGHLEEKLIKLIPHRDMYNTKKVNSNINLINSVNQKSLVDFIRAKLIEDPERVVYLDEFDNGPVTLRELLRPWGDHAEMLNVDDFVELTGSDGITYYEGTQDVQRIRETFLSYDNHIHGAFLAEIVKETIFRLEVSNYKYYEYNVELHIQDFQVEPGVNIWQKMAAWICDEKLFSENIRFIVQIPLHKYPELCSLGRVASYGEFLQLIFRPLFEVTRRPYFDINLFCMLTRIVSFDLMLNIPETVGGINPGKFTSQHNHIQYPVPDEWTLSQNPPAYYIHYHFMLNLAALNHFRAISLHVPLNTFNLLCTDNNSYGSSCSGISCLSSFRNPNRRNLQTTDLVENGCVSFLLAKRVATDGLKLLEHPTLQYLYYMNQVGLLMAPTSDISIHKALNVSARNRGLSYMNHPFIQLSQIGLLVSINASNPLLSSLTREPVMEEYCIAANIVKMNDVELCELMRNSVMNSNYEAYYKRKWIGVDIEKKNESENRYKATKTRGSEDYLRALHRGCFIDNDNGFLRTNVPQIRVRYRQNTLRYEYEFILKVAKKY
ncbi:hypothetical protein BABINDRAFT_160810 [Babjeviella inositovora NRRL Y-12698]|uniref:Uncharacterized protein n=1 Tax=Babjeviella inositovora NRRL Y-12698 TaxID=984486 RepID=A0A1E3QS71_9ASCO|nr:uncharacterized protein BABINDRAFT_160810 [Babjeviella inositovora NRRL Y-12698]ODQ80539.1 hypothetical protein BABINDRAFT_160810 [Babjeviella inositovora NRRL Y-12698]